MECSGENGAAGGATAAAIGNSKNSAQTISGIHVKGNVSIAGDCYVGGILGYHNFNQISDCSVTGTVSISGRSYVGGIAGGSVANAGKQNTSFTNCSVGGDGSTVAISGEYCVGGIGGAVESSTVESVTAATGCTVSGGPGSKIEIAGAQARYFAGGIFGKTGWGTGTANLSNCSVGIDISGTYGLGGLVGYCTGGGTFANCAYRGTVTAGPGNTGHAPTVEQSECAGVIVGATDSRTQCIFEVAGCQFEGSVAGKAGLAATWIGQSIEGDLDVFAFNAAVTDAAGNTSLFSDLQAALDAVEAGQTVSLLKDVALGADTYVAFTNKGTVDQPVTLDLQGHTINGNNVNIYGDSSGILRVSGSQVILTDTSSGEKGGIVNANTDTYATSTVYIRPNTVTQNPSALTIDGGMSIRNDSRHGSAKAISVHNDVAKASSASLVILDAQVVAHGNVIAKSASSGFPAVVSIEGGTFESTSKKSTLNVLSGLSVTSDSISGGVFANWSNYNSKMVDATHCIAFATDEFGKMTATVGAAPDEYVMGVVSDTATDVYVVSGASSILAAMKVGLEGTTVHIDKSVNWEYASFGTSDGNAATMTLDIADGAVLSGSMPLKCADVKVTGAGRVQAGFFSAFKGYTLSPAGSDGVYRCTLSDAQARIGEGESAAYFSTLQNAFNNAKDGQTVTLLKSAEAVGSLAVNKDMTIDLNGFDIEFDAQKHFVVRDGHLTLTGTGTIAEKAGAEFFAPVMVYGSTQAGQAEYSVLDAGEGVTLKGWSGVFIDENTGGINEGIKITVEGKLISVVANDDPTTGHGVYINGQVNQTAGNVPNITLTETSSIVSKGTGIYAAGYAKWNLAGDMTADEEALSIKCGEFDITGGTYHSKGAFADPAVANDNGSEATGAALSITSNDSYAKSTVVNVAGGTFVSDNGFAVYEGVAQKGGVPVAAASYAKLSIVGGSFTGNAGKGAVAITTAVDKKIIAGGTFSSDPSAYVASGYEATQSGEMWRVTSFGSGPVTWNEGFKRVTYQVECDDGTWTEPVELKPGDRIELPVNALAGIDGDVFVDFRMEMEDGYLPVSYQIGVATEVPFYDTDAKIFYILLFANVGNQKAIVLNAEHAQAGVQLEIPYGNLTEGQVNEWRTKLFASLDAVPNQLFTADPVGDKLTLLADADLGEKSFTVNNPGVYFTLDLAGHKITSSSRDATLAFNANVVLTDSTNTPGSVANTGGGEIVKMQGGSLGVTGGTYASRLDGYIAEGCYQHATTGTVLPLPEAADYKVEHYWQNADNDEYSPTPHETETLSGKPYEDTVAAAKSYEGFTVAADPIVQEEIAPEGTTVVKVYYDRNIYTVTWDAAGGTLSGGDARAEVRFGASVPQRSATKSGFLLAGWSPEVSEAMPAHDVDFTARWAAVVEPANPAVNPDVDIAVEIPVIVPGVPGATITDDAKQSAVNTAWDVLDTAKKGGLPTGVTGEKAQEIRNVVGDNPAHKVSAVVSVVVEKKNPEDVADDAARIGGALKGDQTAAVYLDLKVNLIVRNESTGASAAVPLTELREPLVFEAHVPPDSIVGKAVRIAYVHNGVVGWINPDSVDYATGVILFRAKVFSTYAVIASSTVEVAFEPNGGSAVPTQTVPFGGKASEPADPVREGYDFAGWYADKALTQPWDFDAPVEAYLVLYAKWAPAAGGPAASASGPGSGGPLASTGDAALPAAGLLALCALAAAAAAVRASRRRRG